MTKGISSAAAALALTALASTAGLAGERSTGRGSGPVVYVESQGLFYDTIVLGELPAKGRFQTLYKGVGPTGLITEYGPGDPGYLGGRWWVDTNGNGMMDDEDDYFLCPLLGPGRAAP